MIEDYLRDARPTYYPYKSRPEYQIAGLLDRYGLPFMYEKATAVMDRGKLRIWYPDFTLSYGPVIEYFGVTGDTGYQQRTQHKLMIYQQNQIPVVPIYPKDMGGAWQDRLLKRIDNTLEGHLHQYRAQVGGAGIAQTYHSPSRYKAH